MPKKILIGDFFQFEVSGGYGHFIVTHFHPEWGYLIRVQGAVHIELPTDYEKISRRATRQISFYPIGIGIEDGLVWKVGHFEIPDDLAEFPQFRSNVKGENGEYSTPWTIWNGKKSFTIAELGEARHLPIREIITHAVMVERVEQKYRIYNDI